MQQLTPEEIEENYNKFVSYAMKTGEHRKDALEKFFAHFEERLALCPASSRTSFHSCYPGGLISHSLRVLKNCNKLVQIYKEEFPDISKESMIFASLFHDIGKIGSVDHERYLPQTSDWHIKQGMLYEFNPKMPFMSVPDMGVFLMQHFGVVVTHDEWLGIRLNDGQYSEANSEYKLKEGSLALLVHHADVVATITEKNRG